MLPTVGYAGWLRPKWVPFLPEANKTVRISSSIYIKRKGNDFEWQIKWLFIAPASLVGCFVCIQIISNCVPFVEKVTPHPFQKKSKQTSKLHINFGEQETTFGVSTELPPPLPYKIAPKFQNSYGPVDYVYWQVYVRR